MTLPTTHPDPAASVTGAGVHEILGQVQHYPWGDERFLPTFLGAAVDGRPWAEWWLGTHPAAPSHLRDGRRLDAVSGPLAFLVKVLAAARPLSLQVHPDAAEAAAGYAAGRYRDPHPKPELIHALTEFEALCGIRPVAETLALLEAHDLEDLAAHLHRAGVGRTLADLLTGAFDPRPSLTHCAELTRAERAADPIRWVAALAGERPGDPAVLATVLLHHVRLSPGEALRLEAGTPHAYLRGAGVEIMGPSDNVVRCGLTDKPVDVPAALALIDPTPVADPVIPAGEVQDLPVLGITLHRCRAGEVHTSQGPGIALTLDGRGWYVEPGAAARFAMDGFLVG